MPFYPVTLHNQTSIQHFIPGRITCYPGTYFNQSLDQKNWIEGEIKFDLLLVQMVAKALTLSEWQAFGNFLMSDSCLDGNADDGPGS